MFDLRAGDFVLEAGVVAVSAARRADVRAVFCGG